MCYLKKEGTYDLYGVDNAIWQYVINKIINVCKLYNFDYIRTPIFEDTLLYHNYIGKSTDVVSKELYNFIDRSHSSISLRPEGTTGVVRSYIENELYKNNNVTKFYYYGSMFRHEKIENGRYREFQQFGVEMFNNNSIYSSVEIISLAFSIFNSLGLNDVKVYINNLGTYENRCIYEKELKKYFKPHLDNLCDDCKRRYKKNPIRILDCKVDKRSSIVLNAPKIDDYIDKESKDNFDKVIEMLDNLNIDYVVNKNLVRGLNYYTDIVFEFKTNIDGFGSANTICGGGNYNNLVKVDDKSINAIGFAIGLERLIDVLYKKGLLNFLGKVIDINLNFDDTLFCLELRNLGYVTECLSQVKSKYQIDFEEKKYILVYEDKVLLRTSNKDLIVKKLAKIR